MRIGGSVMRPFSSPQEWLAEVKALQYSAVIFPVNCECDEATIRDYVHIIEDNGLIIGEVGVWRNLMAKDPAEQEAVMQYSIRQLELAEKIGANCCVNISGSTVPNWDGYGPENYSRETYEKIIEQSRRIIDAVKPQKTCYSLEPMPWMVPDSPDSYLQLMKDIDRKGFGVHLDYCNMINGMDRYHRSTAFIEECFEKLAPYICSVHMKDVILEDTLLPLVIEERPVGQGAIDLGRVLQLCEKLGKDTTVFVEHLASHEEYAESIRYLRKIAPENGVTIL